MNKQKQLDKLPWNFYLVIIIVLILTIIVIISGISDINGFKKACKDFGGEQSDQTHCVKDNFEYKMKLVNGKYIVLRNGERE